MDAMEPTHSGFWHAIFITALFVGITVEIEFVLDLSLPGIIIAALPPGKSFFGQYSMSLSSGHCVQDSESKTLGW
jgi:hypothetical protein